MTVICETCRTANRDKAMFCIGCAGKLPAFAATGPAALATPDGAGRPRVRATTPTPLQDRNRRVMRWWFAAVLLLGALATALVGWIALTPGRTSTAVSTPAPAASASTSAAAPADVVPFESALSAGESSVATETSSSRPVAEVTAPASPPENVQAPAQRPLSARSQTAQTARAGGNGRADPRTGCEHLFFAFAARCEANHCAEAAYARHPRCDVVRAERQRDDARRNMTSGY